MYDSTYMRHCTQNSQTHRSREYDSGCQMLEAEGIVELLYGEYKVSITLDKYILMICCTMQCLQLTMWYCALQNLLRVDLILSVLHTYTQTHKDTLEGDWYIQYLDCGNGIKSVYISPNTLDCRH